MIFGLYYIVRAAKAVERLVETVRPHIAPITHDITIITQKASGILESVHRQTMMVEESVASFRDISKNVRKFEENILEKVTMPVVKLSRITSALKIGFETFFKRFFRKENDSME